MRKAVREQMRQGGDQVKIMMSGGVASPYDPLDSLQFSPEEVAAAVEEAQPSAAMSAPTPTRPRRSPARHNGVRTIEHGNLIDDESAKLMASRRACILVANLVTYYRDEEAGGRVRHEADMLAKNDLVIDGGLKIAGDLQASRRQGGLWQRPSRGSCRVEQSREFLLRAEVL